MSSYNWTNYNVLYTIFYIFLIYLKLFPKDAHFEIKITPGLGGGGVYYWRMARLVENNLKGKEGCMIFGPNMYRPLKILKETIHLIFVK
jgi:hypothetical protein